MLDHLIVGARDLGHSASHANDAELGCGSGGDKLEIGAWALH